MVNQLSSVFIPKRPAICPQPPLIKTRYQRGWDVDFGTRSGSVSRRSLTDRIPSVAFTINSVPPWYTAFPMSLCLLSQRRS